jgi:CheY-specific phosphatase CheX/anti-anti-sigma regulatory factor
MRPVVRNSIGVFSLQGFLDGGNAPEMITLQDIDASRRMKLSMALISLKKVVHFNKNGIEFLVNALKSIQKGQQITIGFCDVDEQKYKAIRAFFPKEIAFSLFNSYETATLFTKVDTNEPKNILLYSEDGSQRSLLAIELFDKGHTPIVAQTLEEFENKKKNEYSYDAIVDHTYLGIAGEKINARVHKNAIIYSAYGYLDGKLGDNFDIMYHNHSLNVGFTLFIFDMAKVVALNIHALNFFSRLANGAAEYNATIAIAGLAGDKTSKKFKDELEDAGIMFFETLETILNDSKLLLELGGASQAAASKSQTITKSLVNEVPQFINATAYTLKMMTNTTAKKESAHVGLLELAKNQPFMGSSIGFYGNLNGMIILVFPKKIAQKASSLLLGEQTEDEDTLLDSLGELANIIGGQAKTLLSNKEIDVNITLPKTFKNSEEIESFTKGKKGVQVNLTFSGELISFFLTR